MQTNAVTRIAQPIKVIIQINSFVDVVVVVVSHSRRATGGGAEQPWTLQQQLVHLNNYIYMHAEFRMRFGQSGVRYQFLATKTQSLFCAVCDAIDVMNGHEMSAQGHVQCTSEDN